ncbi:aldolase [Croceibacterium mercuriale]|uniref:Aldolase n=1 Tax=Croceibacterium mercuriale TaxID=1572751 RepID=A0A0B2C080_9SPHN|nr:DUF1476 domain-containing protein [Croceibacterium mercuriale]KHL25560.1 aldolase [Croceibacterium mercuriale]
MTDPDDRQHGKDAQFAFDGEIAFRIAARRNRLLGRWAAERMQLTQEETDAYAREIIHAEFEEGGDEAVIRKLLGDLTGAGVETDEAALRTALDEQNIVARRQLMSEN